MSLGEVLASAIFGIRQPTRRDLRPAPRQKLPEISPIFKADTVRLYVSREKEGNWTWSMPDGTIRRSFTRTVAGKLAGGWEGGCYPLAGGSDDPPFKN